MPRRRRRLRIFAPGTRLDKFGLARFLRFRKLQSGTHRRRACRAQYGSRCTDTPSCDIITAMGDPVAATRAARADLLKLVVHPLGAPQHLDPLGSAEDGHPHRLARSARAVLPFRAYPQPPHISVPISEQSAPAAYPRFDGPRASSTRNPQYTGNELYLPWMLYVRQSCLSGGCASRSAPDPTVIKAPGLWATLTWSTRPA